MYGGRGIDRGLQYTAHLLEMDEAPDCERKYTFTGLHMQTRDYNEVELLALGHWLWNHTAVYRMQ